MMADNVGYWREAWLWLPGHHSCWARGPAPGACCLARPMQGVGVATVDNRVLDRCVVEELSTMRCRGAVDGTWWNFTVWASMKFYPHNNANVFVWSVDGELRWWDASEVWWNLLKYTTSPLIRNKSVDIQYNANTSCQGHYGQAGQ